MKITIDVGGTKTRVAHFSNEHTLVQRLIEQTPHNYLAGIATVKRCIDQLTKNGQEKLDGVALAIAGVLNKKDGMVLVSPNLPDWVNKPLVVDLHKTTQTTIVLENDAIAAGLGEANFGAGKGKAIVAFLTLSTGVGGARIVNGKIDVNALGFEPGSQIINIDETKTTDCFLPGGLESYVSGTAFQKLYGIAPKDCTDPTIWNTYAKHLAAGITNAIVLWSPDIVILGGGLTKSADKFLNLLQKHLNEFVVFPQKPPVVIGTLGDEAGLYGGLMLLSL